MTFGGYTTGYGEAIVSQFIWDASSYDWARDTDHILNFAAARKDGIAGVTHKATEGSSYTDPHFGDYAKVINTGNIRFAVVGAYHVLWPGAPVADADHWFNTVDAPFSWWRAVPGVFTWQIDAEKFANMPRKPSLAEIHACGARLEAHGVDPAAIIVYAPHWLYGDTIQGLRYKLWSSAYGNNPVGHYRAVYPGDSGQGWAPYGGVTPTLWQYGSQTIIGEQHTCDASAARVATEAELQALFTGADMPLTQADVDLIWAKKIDSVIDPTKTYSASFMLASTNKDANDAEKAAKAIVVPTAAEIATAVVAALPPAQAGGLTQQQVEDACRAALTGSTITPAP